MFQSAIASLLSLAPAASWSFCLKRKPFPYLAQKVGRRNLPLQEAEWNHRVRG